MAEAPEATLGRVVCMTDMVDGDGGGVGVVAQGGPGQGLPAGLPRLVGDAQQQGALSRSLRIGPVTSTACLAGIEGAGRRVRLVLYAPGGLTILGLHDGRD